MSGGARAVLREATLKEFPEIEGEDGYIIHTQAAYEQDAMAAQASREIADALRGAGVAPSAKTAVGLIALATAMMERLRSLSLSEAVQLAAVASVPPDAPRH